MAPWDVAACARSVVPRCRQLEPAAVKGREMKAASLERDESMVAVCHVYMLT